MLLKDRYHFWSLAKSIKYDLFALAFLSVFIGYFDNNVYLLEEFSLSIPAFLSTAIVVSLAFKTNKAYGRWWEAKEIWEGIANSTRTWNRIVLNYITRPEDRAARTKLIHRQLLWAVVLKDKLRNQPVEEIPMDLTREEIQFLMMLDNMHQGLLVLQARTLKDLYRKGIISIFIHVEMEEIIKELEVYMGRAERIKKTDFPVLYDMIIRFCIYLFCIISTYFISDGTILFEASVSFVISALFIGIAHISSTLQDPFENKPSDTPMNQICHALNVEIEDYMSDVKILTKPIATRYYTM